MQELCVAQTRPGVAAVRAEPLSPPHSESSHTEDSDKPMDLSSGGGVAAGLTQLFNQRTGGLGGGGNSLEPASMALSEHSQLFNARLAELVKQQHRQSEERERESKRKWEERDHSNEQEEEEEVERETDSAPLPCDPASQSTARHLIRAGWEGNSGETNPASPAGSSSGSESGPGERREEKRRRLDLLLTKKFDRGGGSSGVENILMSTPPPSERETSPASDRRPSTDSTGTGGEQKPNRRKQAQPSRPASPPYPALGLSLRPNSDLFPPVATSTPRRKDQAPAPVPNRENSPSRNSEEKENKGEARPDVLQMQLSSGLLAGLGSGSLPPPEMVKALQYNPLLYYSYYAQMLSALQAQQKLIELNSSVGGAATPPPPSNNNNNINNNNSGREKLSPLKMPSSLSALKDNNQDPRLLFNSYYPPNSPASSLSPGGYKPDDEPRKRAPRALTGRYVRTGTAASPRVLQILRKKIEDRLKLKELLGENSHLYFGQTKQNSPYKSPLNQKNKKKF